MRHTPRHRLLLGLSVLALASSLLAEAARSPYRAAHGQMAVFIVKTFGLVW